MQKADREKRMRWTLGEYLWRLAAGGREARRFPVTGDQGARLREMTAPRPSRRTLSSLLLPHPAQTAGLDAKAISRAKLGDIGAFTEIVQAYYARCLRFARAMLV